MQLFWCKVHKWRFPHMQMLQTLNIRIFKSNYVNCLHINSTMTRHYLFHSAPPIRCTKSIFRNETCAPPCRVLMIYCVLCASGSPSAQPVGGGRWLHLQLQPVETECVHPRPAGAHRLLQHEVQGTDDELPQVVPTRTNQFNSLWTKYNNSSTTSRPLRTPHRGAPSCTRMLGFRAQRWAWGGGKVV